MDARDQAFLERAERVLLGSVRPKAELIDGSPLALGEALDLLAAEDLLASRRPLEYGGPAVSEQAFRRFQELSARASGTLSFLMTQHQSAVSLISKSDNHALKERLLPYMHDAQRVGIGISQLRRGGPPMTTAEPVEGGYRLQGSIPWVTGAGFFHSFVVGARLPDSRALFGVLPFSPWMALGAKERLAKTEAIGGHIERLEQGGEITFSEPMRLAAMVAANTVSLELRDVFLPDSDVVFIKPANWPERNDMVNIVLQGHFALGCAQAGIDVVRRAYESKERDSIRAAADRLQAKLDAVRLAASQIPADLDSETTEEKLQIRAQAIALAFSCAQAAIVASSGAANVLNHPAQRIHREALVFAVSAQTGAIMDATLERIAPEA